MNTKKITLSLLTSLALTSAVYADGGELKLNANGGDQTTEYTLLYPNATANPKLGDINYLSAIQNPVSVSDASFEFDFSDTNITDAMLVNTAIQDLNSTDLSTFVATYESMTSAKIAVYKKLNSDTGVVNTERNFIIQNSGDLNTTTRSNIEYKFNVGGNEISLEVWSGSGNAQKRDSATDSLASVNTIPQFKFYCVAQFDALINFENNDTTFVPTGHGHQDSKDQDTLVFKIDNRKGILTNSVDGNATEIMISTDANLTALGFTTLVGFYGKQLSTDLNGTATIMNNGSDINLTIDNAIPAGISTWYATLDGNTSATLSEVDFTMSTINIEGNSSVQPQIEYTANANAGEWKNHAFIAQIAGSEVGGAHDMKTKYTIVNRSCASVKPAFDLIYKGTVYPTVMPGIDVDNQEEFTLSELITAAGITLTDTDSSKLAVEITLPGIAEDFYIYAQVKNSKLKQFKDLPVYNTSTRD